MISKPYLNAMLLLDREFPRQISTDLPETRQTEAPATEESGAANTLPQSRALLIGIHTRVADRADRKLSAIPEWHFTIGSSRPALSLLLRLSSAKGWGWTSDERFTRHRGGGE